METMTEVTECVNALTVAFKAAVASCDGTTGPYDLKAQKAVYVRWGEVKKGLKVLRSSGKLTTARADDFFTPGTRFYM